MIWNLERFSMFVLNHCIIYINQIPLFVSNHFWYYTFFDLRVWTTLFVFVILCQNIYRSYIYHRAYTCYSSGSRQLREFAFNSSVSVLNLVSSVLVSVSLPIVCDTHSLAVTALRCYDWCHSNSPTRRDDTWTLQNCMQRRSDQVCCLIIIIRYFTM